ncbi:MAG: hypothetical protein WBE26_09745 [Phycisphaerae bacterium]
MGIRQWLTCLFRRGNRIPDGMPEVMGQVVDEHGERHEIRRGPIRHDALTRDQLKRVARLRDVLREAYPMTLDGWVDGFIRDAHPESEIQIIEAVAVVYQQLTQSVKLTHDDKVTLYGVLCVLSASGPSDEIDDKIPEGLPAGTDLFRLYCAGRAEPVSDSS